MKQQKLAKTLGGIVITLLIILSCMIAVLFMMRLQNEDTIQEQIPQQSATPAPPMKEIKELDLLMAGDALLHSAVYADAKTTAGTYDFTEMMSSLDRVTRRYDLKYYNQETILGGEALGLSTYPRFNSPQQFGDAMMNLGFNLVSLANNHTLDRGEEAIFSGLDYWDQQKAMTAGSYRSFEDRNQVDVREMNGITYTMLAYTYGTNGIPIPQGKEYLVNVYTKEMLEEDIQRARSQVDVLLVSMHWGDEYSFTPNAKQEELALMLADLDVDVIIGSHPHVVQPIQWIDDTLCVYSLGNMISAQDGIYKRVGLLASVKITKTIENGVSTISLSEAKGDLIFTQYKKGYKDFKLKFFDEIEPSELDDIWGVYEEYGDIVTSKDDTIQLGGL